MTYRSDTDLRISTSDRGNAYGPAPVRPDAEPIWSLPISGKEFDNYVVFHDDLVIIHREYKEVIAVKAGSGEQVWAVEDPHFQPEMKIEGHYWPNSFECADGQVMISSRRFCILDANDGSIMMGRTKRDAQNFPDAFAYKQYGDWLRKHTGDHWVNRLTGEAQSELPEPLSAYQEDSYKQPYYLTNLQEQDFIAGRYAHWQDEADKDGTRILVCRDIKSLAPLWSAAIKFGPHFSGHIEWPSMIFSSRKAVIASADRHGTGEFVMLDAIAGREVLRNATQGRISKIGMTGCILHPPEDAKDLLLIQQVDGRAFDLAHAKDGETEDGWVYYLSAIDTTTGAEVWNTRESLGCRYKPQFKNPYRYAGSEILARTHNTLWVKHTAFNDIRYKAAKPGDYWQGEECKGGEKLPLAKESTVLAAVDHNTGAVLHTRKLPATAEYAGQNDGRLYLREGRKIVCYA